jgi:putative copper export protein
MLRAACALHFVALGLWVGGLAAIGLVVAPTAFRNPETRPTAGIVVGDSLRLFGKVEAVCAAAALITGILLQSVGAWGPGVRWLRMSVLIVMALILVCTTGHLYPELERLRGDPSPAARERFQRLHGASERLVGANLLAGLALLGLSAATLRSPDGG